MNLETSNSSSSLEPNGYNWSEVLTHFFDIALHPSKTTFSAKPGCPVLGTTHAIGAGERLHCSTTLACRKRESERYDRDARTHTACSTTDRTFHLMYCPTRCGICCPLIPVITAKGGSAPGLGMCVRFATTDRANKEEVERRRREGGTRTVMLHARAEAAAEGGSSSRKGLLLPRLNHCCC